MSTEEVAHAQERAQRRRIDRLLFNIARQGGRWVVVLMATTLLISAAELALPAVVGKTVDAVLRGGAVGVWLLTATLLITALVTCDALDDLAAGTAIARSTASVRHRVLRHFLSLGVSPSRALPVGEVAARLVGNAADSARVAPDVVRSVVSLIPAVGGIVALVLIDPLLAATFVAGLPVLTLVLRAFVRNAAGINARYLSVQGRIAGRLLDAVAGGRTIAAAGTTQQEATRILAPVEELHREGVAMWRAQMRLTAQDTVLVSLLEVLVLAVGGVLLARGRISAGALIAASQYVPLASGIGAAATGMTRLVHSRAAAGRVADILDQPPMRYGSAPAPAGGGRLEFHEVSVRLGDQLVLSGIDLVVPAGALVAVVGRSGSGKSLLAALAARLIDPQEGEVLLDGVPLHELSRSELRREIGCGFERPVLIGENFEDAIAWGTDRPSRDQVISAARAARADDFIRRMPLAYETALADAPLSGGEAQRIGLARTFAHARRVVVLDDVAASLDTVTEHQIAAVLTGELADRTRIVIAHRASTAARTDAVIWLEDRGVRAFAPHSQLWREPDYRALFEAQAETEPVLLVATRNGGSR